jgi:hypothetical protein
MIIQRPGTRSIYLPGPDFGVEVRQPLGGAVPWWLTGGIAAANCIAAYQPKGAANLAASYVNFAHPGTYDAAPGVAPGWDTTIGWIFSIPKYLKTGIVPTLTYSMMVQFSGYTTGATAKALAGCYSTSTQNFLIHAEMSAGFVGYWNGGSLTGSASMAAGNLCVAGKTGYKNGVIDGTIPAGGTNNAIEIYIGALNGAGTPSQHTACNMQALAIYDIDISAYVAGLRAAMAAL